MMTSSNGTFSALLALCAGNAQRPVTRSFDVFFELRLIKRLSKHSPGWWFKTLSRPFWRHCNVLEIRGGVAKQLSSVEYNSTFFFKYWKYLIVSYYIQVWYRYLVQISEHLSPSLKCWHWLGPLSWMVNYSRQILLLSSCPIWQTFRWRRSLRFI